MACLRAKWVSSHFVLQYVAGWTQKTVVQASEVACELVGSCLGRDVNLSALFNSWPVGVVIEAVVGDVLVVMDECCRVQE